MYNELDSRALGRADCYAQRFMRAGDYRYNVVPGHAQSLSTDYPFVVHVKDKHEGKAERKMAQHTLRVTSDGKGFSVSPATLTIALGDMVVWNGGGAIPFAVVGEQAFFNSHRMVNECGFSHAFGKAGEYHWQDAFGSKLSGVVRVRDPDCAKDKDLRKWRAALAEGSLVTIADGKADRTEIDILTGQTVFFAIVTTPGISITDGRLLANLYEAPCSSAS
jgi:plastocyanin